MEESYSSSSSDEIYPSKQRVVGNIFYKTFHTKEPGFHSGVKFAEKDVLMFAIALMGINLNFTMLANLGFATILIIVLRLSLGRVVIISVPHFTKALFSRSFNFPMLQLFITFPPAHRFYLLHFYITSKMQLCQ